MDLKKLREKLQKLEDKNNRGNSLLWKPEEGQQVVRIVPYKYDQDWPFVELYFYYAFNPRTILSPASFGKPDPIKEFCEKLMRSGDKEDYAVAKSIQAKQRIYVPILVRGKEEEGVKYWGFGSQIFTELVKLCNDPEWGDLTDLESGRDITVEYEKAVSAEAYPKTLVRPKPNKSIACKDKAQEDAVKNMADVKTVWEEMDYDALKAILQKFIDNAPDEDTKAEEVLGAPKKDTFLDELSTPVDKNAKVLDTSKVSDDFDDLFKD